MSHTAHRTAPLVFFAATVLLPSGALADLVGHWKFNEGSGTVYADSSPNGNDATSGGGLAGWSMDTPDTGFPNTASLQFDGTSSYVQTGFNGIGGNAPRTVAFWIKTSQINNHGIVAWGASTVNGAKWHIRVNSAAGNGPLGAIRTESQADYTIGSIPVADGEWHHVASVYPDGGGELATVLHYIDGVLDEGGSDNPSTQPVNTSTTADAVTVGRRTQGAAQNYFPGLVDDVRIYDRALSAAEVAALSGASPTTDGLVFHLPFEEGTGDTTADLGSGGNDGTINIPPVPMPTWSTDAPPPLTSSLLFTNSGDSLFTEFGGIAGTAPRSVAFWFKAAPSNANTDNGILGWGDSTGAGLKWHARINTGTVDGPAGALRLEIQNGRTVATTPVTDDQWHHAAIVFPEDADPDIEDVVFYLDGEVDPVSMLTSVPIDTRNEGPNSIPVILGGRDQTGALRGFEGNLADLRIYDNALTQEEVQQIITGVPPTRLQLELTIVGEDLQIRWDSTEGLLYRLRSEVDPSTSDPAEWPVYDDNKDIAATPPQNTLTIPLPPETERYFVIESYPPPPVTLFFDDLEGDTSGWETGLLPAGTAGTDWELGTPSMVGPPTAFSGANCFATNIDGDYATNAGCWLRSPAVNLADAPEATLRYWQYLRTEELDFDTGEVVVLDATDDSLIAPVAGNIFGQGTEWQEIRHSVPEAALGRSVRFEFRFFSDDFANEAGWYLDDIEVTKPGTLP